MVWSTEAMTWKVGLSIGVPPTSRFGHTSTAIGPHLLIFGGWEHSKAQNEIIVLREWNQNTDGPDQQEPSGILDGSIPNDDEETSQRMMDDPIVEEEER